MMWTECSFVNALNLMITAFQSAGMYDMLALVWREGGEYRVMGSWEVKSIKYDLDPATLRIVLWLNRAEAGILLSPCVGDGT